MTAALEGGPIQLSAMLEGLRILLLEDEFLIAMDVEQLCRDHGAADVAVAQPVLTPDEHFPERPFLGHSSPPRCHGAEAGLTWVDVQ